MGPGDAALTIAVFAVGTALWCLAGCPLVSCKRLVQVLERSGRWIVPAVFVGLGSYILHGSGLLGKVFQPRPSHLGAYGALGCGPA
jgi:cadmium resistance protein CadD (predicted permease)